MRTPVKKNPQLSSRTDLSRTKSIRAESPCLSHAAIGRLHKYTVEKLRSDFNFAGSINAHAQSIVGSAFQFGHHAVEGTDTIITSLLSPMGLSVNQQPRTFPMDPVLTLAKKILEVFRLLTTVLISTVSLMLISVKQQNQKPQRVKLKQKQKKIIR